MFASKILRILALAGAIAINLLVTGALVILPMFTPLNLPLRGYIVLWIVAIAVLAIGFVELVSKSWKNQ